MLLVQESSNYKLKAVLGQSSLEDYCSVVACFKKKQPIARHDVFVLNRIEGFPVEDVAKITMQPENEVKRNPQHANEFVRQKLIDSGMNSSK